jgi:putative FmdB family regulatory protein
MPLYDYRCSHCGECSEQRLPITAITDTITCPGCGHPADRVYSVPAIRFTGPGFHNTDYRQGKKREDQKDQPTPQETKEKVDAGKGSSTGKSA